MYFYISLVICVHRRNLRMQMCFLVHRNNIFTSLPCAQLRNLGRPGSFLARLTISMLRPRFSSSRRTSRRSSRRRSSCSQMRSTRQPALRSVRLASRSRCLLPRIFASQNACRDFGRVKCRGHPCQKQPSTNTASLSFGKTKSGLTENVRTRLTVEDAEAAEFRSKGISCRPSWLFLRVLRELCGKNPTPARPDLPPGIWLPASGRRDPIDTDLRQPVIPFARKTAISRSSVSLFPLPRMQLITAERLVLVKTSDKQ